MIIANVFEVYLLDDDIKKLKILADHLGKDLSETAVMCLKERCEDLLKTFEQKPELMDDANA